MGIHRANIFNKIIHLADEHRSLSTGYPMHTTIVNQRMKIVVIEWTHKRVIQKITKGYPIPNWNNQSKIWYPKGIESLSNLGYGYVDKNKMKNGYPMDTLCCMG